MRKAGLVLVCLVVHRFVECVDTLAGLGGEVIPLLVEQMHRVSGFGRFVLAGVLDVYFRHWLFAWIRSTGLRSGRS